jgi:hypothetical protein
MLYFGLIRAKVLVDRTRLHHPLVFRHSPGTADEKLVAGACFRCGGRKPIQRCEHENDLVCDACGDGVSCHHIRCCSDCQSANMSSECPHSDEERAFWVECTTEELNMALRDGDKLLEISEVHHFSTRDRPMRDYIFAWYKAKQRASGWPPHVEALEGDERTAAETKVLADLDEQSLRAFGRPMGLDRAEIKLNKGARQVAKIMLNSFYGKFGTRPERTSVDYVRDATELGKVVDKKNKSLRVSFIVNNTIGDDRPVTVMLRESDAANTQVARTTSVYVAIFVTAYGRLKLYDEQLKPAGASALYWDTDSCLKVMKRSDPVPPCSDFLGEWGHEPEKDSTAFASLGPKTYALDLVSGKTMAKCKGISRAKADEQMNVNMFREVLTGERPCILTRQEQWSRTSAPVDGDCGYKIRVLRDFGRTTRLTAAKRAPGKAVFEGEDLKSIATVPFGHSSLASY